MLSHVLTLQHSARKHELTVWITRGVQRERKTGFKVVIHIYSCLDFFEYAVRLSPCMLFYVTVFPSRQFKPHSYDVCHLCCSTNQTVWFAFIATHHHIIESRKTLSCALRDWSLRNWSDFISSHYILTGSYTVGAEASVIQQESLSFGWRKVD